MFNNKPYSEVNREERFYCALFGHALLSSQLIRERFAKLIKSKFGLSLKSGVFEIFLEVAALRDYWNDLGDPIVYSEETHRRRRIVITSILQMMNVPETAIDTHHFFWTSDQHKKLWSPGKWEPRLIRESGFDELIKIRWAFNAKPDILIISNSTALMIEGKLESGEGRSEDSGYQQYDIQELIISLLQLLVPPFKNLKFFKTILALDSPNGISWKDVLTIAEDGELDDFTVRCFSQLRRYE